MTVRIATLAALAALLAGCLGGLQQAAEPALQDGPHIAFEVVNRSDAEVEIGYDFESAMSAGGGNGAVGSCRRVVMPFGNVAGSFRVTLDGIVIGRSEVPGVVGQAYLVVPVQIEPDGSASVGVMRVAPEISEPLEQEIPGCG